MEESVIVSNNDGGLHEAAKVEDTVEPSIADTPEAFIGEDREETTESSGQSSSTHTISNQFMVEEFNFSISDLQLKKASRLNREMCRICHQDDLSEPSLAMCNCRGSVRFVHRSCLERWLVASDSQRCELCGFNFTVERKSKYGIFRALVVWLSDEDCKRDRLRLIRDSIQILSTLPIFCFINVQGSALLEYLSNDETETLISFFLEPEPDFQTDLQEFSRYCLSWSLVVTLAAVNMLSIGWMYVTYEGHYLLWRKWYRAQCTLKVLPPDQ